MSVGFDLPLEFQLRPSGPSSCPDISCPLPERQRRFQNSHVLRPADGHNLATATARLYNQLLRVHIIPALEGMSIEDIGVDAVQRLFNGMDTSKETKQKAKRLLNQILNAAIDDLLAKNPLKSNRIKITGAESTTTEVYSVEQMRYLVRHIDDLQRPLDRAYLALQALHPLRLEEVLDLRWADIDLNSMTLKHCIKGRSNVVQSVAAIESVYTV